MITMERIHNIILKANNDYIKFNISPEGCMIQLGNRTTTLTKDDVKVLLEALDEGIKSRQKCLRYTYVEELKADRLLAIETAKSIKRAHKFLDEQGVPSSNFGENMCLFSRIAWLCSYRQK